MTGKPTYAFAVADPVGQVCVPYIRRKASDAREDFGHEYKDEGQTDRQGWHQARKDGFRIVMVKITARGSLA